MMHNLQSFWGDRGTYSAPPYPLAGWEGVTPPPAPTPSLFIHLPDQCFAPSNAHDHSHALYRGVLHYVLALLF